MTATRWPNQDLYATPIQEYADANGVPWPIAYGLIGQESGFNPQAIRNEPTVYCAATGQTGDASYGLTQVLYCTALGLGYGGVPTGLFDVETNVALGLSLLGSLIASHGGDVPAALSAYNGGDRPSLGYGARRSDGTFANQAYVDNITNNAAYFDTYLSERYADVTSSGSTDSAGATVSADASSSTGDVIGLLALIGALAAAAAVVARS